MGESLLKILQLDVGDYIWSKQSVNLMHEAGLDQVDCSGLLSTMSGHSSFIKQGFENLVCRLFKLGGCFTAAVAIGVALDCGRNVAMR